jgi:hypothetical protein
MLKAHRRSRIPLPRGWKRRVRSAVLDVISLERYCLASAHVLASNSPDEAVRRRSDYQRLQDELGTSTCRPSGPAPALGCQSRAGSADVSRVYFSIWPLV